MAKGKRSGPSRKTLVQECFYFRDGKCYFLAGHPEEPVCICPNWCSFKGGKYRDWYNLIKDKKYKGVFPKQGDVVQTQFIFPKGKEEGDEDPADEILEWLTGDEDDQD